MNQILKPNQKIAFIQANWHSDIVGEGRKSFFQEMEKVDVTLDDIDVFDVAGVLEIPLQAQYIANTGDYAVIIASGLVVNGGIYRHDFVAQVVMDGMMQVQLDTGVPILSTVLTPHHFHEHEEHHKFFFDHFKIKGQEVANACVMTLKNMARFNPMDKAA